MTINLMGDEMKFTRLILPIQFLLSLGFAVVAVATDHHSIFAGDRIAGIVLAVAGLSILAAAIAAYKRTVGTFLVKPSPEPSRQGGLISHGIYSLIRHPFYTATPLVLSGVALGLQKPWCLLVVVCAVLLLYWKSIYEEELLGARFPEYPSYRQRTGRFLPRIGRNKSVQRN
jgi:protein-S-isoprenylcysteine O-methyltransferase Ste14